ncbi:MAG: hypothetical protein ACREFY_10385 [Acetobacteraceae bacterium]
MFEPPDLPPADPATAARSTADATTTIADPPTANRSTANRPTANRSTGDRSTGDTTAADHRPGDRSTADSAAAVLPAAALTAIARAAADPATADPRTAARAFITLAGVRRWVARQGEIAHHAATGPRAGQAVRQRHVIERALARLAGGAHPTGPAERHIAALAAAAVALSTRLSPAGQVRLAETIDAGLAGEATLIPLFHLLRTAALHRARGFAVRFAKLEEATAFDLLLSRGTAEAEVVCDVVSAEQGRPLPRGAWLRLADRIDADLQTWLAAHPGRYLLKMTLPDGLAGDDPDGAALAALHARIRDMLARSARTEQDAAVVLRLDPLLLAGAQAEPAGLMTLLRREFGPEAHLAAITAGRGSAAGGLFILAARTGREDEVAGALARRMAELAPTRLSGTRPGILAMFVEDTDRAEWRSLRERLQLEGKTRQFLTHPEAQPVVAITCASRLELFGLEPLDAAEGGELRFRNPAHPAAHWAALAPAVLSSV